MDLTKIKIVGEYYKQLGKRVNFNGYRVSSSSDENVLRLIVVMAVQLCEHTKNH